MTYDWPLSSLLVIRHFVIFSWGQSLRVNIVFASYQYASIIPQPLKWQIMQVKQWSSKQRNKLMKLFGFTKKKPSHILWLRQSWNPSRKLVRNFRKANYFPLSPLLNHLREKTCISCKLVFCYCAKKVLRVIILILWVLAKF